jgi:H+/Cl- antiporter ClcA
MIVRAIPFAVIAIGFAQAFQLPPPRAKFASGIPTSKTEMRSLQFTMTNRRGVRVIVPIQMSEGRDVERDRSDKKDVAITNDPLPINGARVAESAIDPTLSNLERTIMFRTTSVELVQAAIVGVLTGGSVGIFKLSIEAVRDVCYSRAFLVTYPWLRTLIPAAGGLAVGFLLLFGAFPVGLRGTVKEVDEESKSPYPGLNIAAIVRKQLNLVRKSAAAVFTLGTGCSLGPEGPCVEIGMTVARAVIDVKKRRTSEQLSLNRLLLACGAAAGVAAGFNAPIAGVFFALEIMQNAFTSVQTERTESESKDSKANDNNLISTGATITPILLASVLSALISRTLLGNHLVLELTTYSLKTPLVELPLYLLLGCISGCVAFVFGFLANKAQALFSGDIGFPFLRRAMQSVPKPIKPVIGGLLCGFVGLSFPQILFFGYETLNSLLANNSLPTTLLLALLAIKTIMTAVSAGSGLVGGTFAPSLFLGAMTGASFHNVSSKNTLAIDFKLQDILLILLVTTPVDYIYTFSVCYVGRRWLRDILSSS